jgi:hypothetical protein
MNEIMMLIIPAASIETKQISNIAIVSQIDFVLIQPRNHLDCRKQRTNNSDVFIPVAYSISMQVMYRIYIKTEQFWRWMKRFG